MIPVNITFTDQAQVLIEPASGPKVLMTGIEPGSLRLQNGCDKLALFMSAEELRVVQRLVAYCLKNLTLSDEAKRVLTTLSPVLDKACSDL
jgi:hypothetical protein